MARKRTPKPKFQERYLAFVDILGFREIVRRMEAEPELFSTIRDALKMVDRQARQLQVYRESQVNERKRALEQRMVPLPVPDPELQMTAFSDCYVLSETLPAWHVLAAVQALASAFIEMGILTRGAVVSGSVYHTERVLFGPAVIEAYDIESQVAKYPRILVTESVRTAAWGYHRGLCRGRLFQEDTDGCWFINILAPPMSRWQALSDISIGEDAREFLMRVRGSLENLILRAHGNPEHLSKVSWIVDKFNKIADQGEIAPIRFPDATVTPSRQ